MASDTNKVLLSGTLTRDAEVKRTQGEKFFTKFSIAVNKYYRPQGQQEWKSITNYVDITIWESQTLSKGDKVEIIGRLQQETWEKDGKKFSRLSVVADEVKLVPREKKDPTGMGVEVPGPKFEDASPIDDDMPF